MSPCLPCLSAHGPMKRETTAEGKLMRRMLYILVTKVGAYRLAHDQRWARYQKFWAVLGNAVLAKVAV